MKKRYFGIKNTVISFLSLIFAVLFLTPVIWAFFCSIKPEGGKISGAFDWFTAPYTLQNYPEVIFSSSVSVWLSNSILIACVSVILTITATSMAAYPMAKFRFRGQQILFLFFTIGLIVPGEATIVPLFITANQLRLIDTYAGMILPGIAISLNLIIVSSFFRSIPNELIEAARIDGAHEFTIFRRIIIPLGRPVLITIGIFSFIGSWNNYLWPLLCALSERMFTLPVGIPTYAETYSVDYVKPMTANMIASIPAILFYLLLEQKITKGTSLSGIKG